MRYRVNNATVNYTVKSDKGFNKTGTLTPTAESPSSTDITVPVGAKYTITGSVSKHTCRQNGCTFSWKEFSPSSINIPMLNASSSYTSKAVFGCSGCSASTCVSASNNTTVTLDKSPTVSNAISIWPSFYLSKPLDDYVEFEVSCDFKNLNTGQIETYYAVAGIEAGKTSPSQTGVAMRGSAGVCYEQLTPCTVTKIKPSTANICQPMQETTSKAQTPSGCITSNVCNMLFESTGNTGRAAEGKCTVTGGNGSTYNVPLNKGNMYKGSLNTLTCGLTYSISCAGTGSGSTYKLTPTPSSVKNLTGTQKVTVKFELGQETKPSTMNITVTRNGDRVSPNGNFGYFYDFSINWDTEALEPVKFVVSGNHYRTNTESPSAAGCEHGVSVGILDQSGTSLRFLYEKNNACTLNQTTGGGPGHIFLQDFYCRIIIGSQEFKCNYSGTTTIDGVTVNVKNNTNDVYDNGDRNDMWGSNR